MSNTGGRYNTAVGYQALLVNSTDGQTFAEGNSALGYKVPPITSPDAFVVMDANNVILEETSSIGPDVFPVYLDGTHYAFILNDHLGERVALYPLKHTGGMVFYESDDCTGQALVENDAQRWLDFLQGFGYGVSAPLAKVSVITRSLVRLDGWSQSQSEYFDEEPCEISEAIRSVVPLVTYTPAPEILNAAYPVRLEQLP